MGAFSGGGFDMVGDFQQMIIFESALSNSDRILVENYLNNINSIPEPTMILPFALGALAIGVRRKRNGSSKLRGKKMSSIRNFAIATTFVIVLSASVTAQKLPSVKSAELIAHFVAQPDSLTLGEANEVLAWAAVNDPAIVLTTAGTDDPGNIVYEASALGGLGSLIVRDYAGDNRYMRGSLNQQSDLDNVTIFWLGKYEPGSGWVVDRFGRPVCLLHRTRGCPWFANGIIKLMTVRSNYTVEAVPKPAVRLPI